MKVVKTQRYLEDVILSSGSLRDTIEDRRLGETLQDFWDPCRNARHPKSRGWPQPEDGQVINWTIYSSEAWGKISKTELTRPEQVDMALIRSLVWGNSKFSRAFTILEFGVLGIWHLIMIGRLMFHHQLVTRTNNELTKKVYLK